MHLESLGSIHSLQCRNCNHSRHSTLQDMLYCNIHLFCNCQECNTQTKVDKSCHWRNTDCSIIYLLLDLKTLKKLTQLYLFHLLLQSILINSMPRQHSILLTMLPMPLRNYLLLKVHFKYCKRVTNSYQNWMMQYFC